jgi:hypothetical protein
VPRPAAALGSRPASEGKYSINEGVLQAFSLFAFPHFTPSPQKQAGQSEAAPGRKFRAYGEFKAYGEWYSPARYAKCLFFHVGIFPREKFLALSWSP